MAPYWVSAFGQISYRSFAPQATGSKLIRDLLGLSGWVRRWKKWLVQRWYVSVTQTGFFNKFGKLKWKLPTKKLNCNLLAFEYSVSFCKLDLLNLRRFFGVMGIFHRDKRHTSWFQQNPATCDHLMHFLLLFIAQWRAYEWIDRTTVNQRCKG